LILKKIQAQPFKTDKKFNSLNLVGLNLSMRCILRAFRVQAVCFDAWHQACSKGKWGTG